MEKYGKFIKKNWANIAKFHGIEIRIFGQNSMPGFTFVNNNHLLLSTFFSQEMLKKVFLANTTVTMTDAYNLKIIKKYLKVFSEVFKEIKKSLKKNKINLRYSVKHETFQRLTG